MPRKRKLPKKKVKIWSELLENLQGLGNDLELRSYRTWRIVTGDRDLKWIIGLTWRIQQCIEEILENWEKLQKELKNLRKEDKAK
ncbi:MAG: hypothetical protein ACTSRP_01830 [Candidatus Helarchaeota archaeon]